ncbi:PREDICTED: UPF0691 protein C9orf116 homolog [Cyprinodon variegatus]|nr:PREDICTED: UPF0691 protein C9orf116 homolog [Cyprinodon variegatus]
MEDQRRGNCYLNQMDPNLRQELNNPECFHGDRMKKSHPLYRTSNQTYGSKKPTVHEMQTRLWVTSHRFSELQGQAGMYRDHSFNTAIERSKVMLSTETQNRRFQQHHMNRYGNQIMEQHQQNKNTLN